LLAEIGSAPIILLENPHVAINHHKLEVHPMVQCPSCSSYNDGDAAFCSQCGAAMEEGARHKSRVRTAKVSKAKKQVLPFLATLVILAALAAVILIAYLPDKEGGDMNGKKGIGVRDKSLVARGAASAPESREGSGSLEPRPAVEELQTLDAPRASKI